jgi:phage baseplate assembly protein gpV
VSSVGALPASAANTYCTGHNDGSTFEYLSTLVATAEGVQVKYLSVDKGVRSSLVSVITVTVTVLAAAQVTPAGPWPSHCEHDA